MKRLMLFLFAAAAVLFSACTSDPAEIDYGPAPIYQEETDSYIVIDHKTKVIGEDVPEWVTRYISDGVFGVEAMPIFADSYVFVGEDKGRNLNALRQWASNFTVVQDLAQMVSSRVQVRFSSAAAGSPDDAYGRYFESIVKNVSNASFSGARKENDFWLLKRYFAADGQSVEREEYEYYVLVTIDKALLQRQIDAILDKTEADVTLTRSESTAVDRVKEVFYEGF